MSNRLMCRFVWGCIVEDRRDWEVGLRYGVRMSLVITLESIEFSFFYICYTLYNIYFSKLLLNQIYVLPILRKSLFNLFLFIIQVKL